MKAGQRGLQFACLDEMWRFAQCVSTSGLAPKGLETPQAILVALQMGAEVGLSPMASLQNIAVINGRPAVWGDAMLAICRGSGLFDESAFEEVWTGSGEDRACTCTVRRLPQGKPIIRSFSLKQAKSAKLDGRDTWKMYPDRMLQMRARSFALRDTFADVLRGFRSVEEVQDEPAVAPAPKNAARSNLDDLAAKLGTVEVVSG